MEMKGNYCLNSTLFRNSHHQSVIDETSMSYLMNKRKEKTKDIDINNFKPKEYLMSKNLSVTEVQNLYKLRNCMIDVKGNFHSGNKDNMWCRICYLFTETQQHLVDCSPITDKLRGKDILSLVNGDQ